MRRLWSPEADALSRRNFLAGSAAVALVSGLGSARAAEHVRIFEAAQGSATALWRSVLASGIVPAPQDVAFDWIGGGPGQLQLQLTAGALDVSVFGAIGVAELAPRGFDIAIFGPALNNHGRWIVRGDSPYKTPHDLVGKTIATVPEASDTYRHARLAAALHGIDLKKDLRVIFGPPTANLALFSRGDVDAVIAIEPTATRLVAGGAREIARVGDMWRVATGDAAPLFLVGLAAKRAWIEQNPKTATHIAALFGDLHRRLRSDPSLIAQQAAAFGIPAGERAAIDLLPRRMAEVYATEWNEAVFANIDHQIGAAVKAGMLPSTPVKPVYLEAKA